MTTYEVWAAIKNAHELVPIGSYSAPQGGFHDPSQGIMETAYGFEAGDFPIMGATTTWDIDRENPPKRLNEKTVYVLYVPEATTNDY